MKKQRILLLSLIVAMISFACSSDDLLGVTDTPSMWVIYPAKYAGTASIDTGNVCEKSAQATFTAFGNHTCVLLIDYQGAYQDFDGLMPGDPGYGACVTSQELGTIRFAIDGKFNEKKLVCEFRYCNEHVYSASGAMYFDIVGAYTNGSTPITCTDSNGKTQISVLTDSLSPLR